MQLPEKFLERMKISLQEEFDDFLKCYENPPYIALRVNTLKVSAEEFIEIVDFCKERVPWCETGYYYAGKQGTGNAAAAGLFYSQEPSAMIAAELLCPKEGDKVLDLCAAPGGKSTQIAAKLNGKGLLVSNEITLSRAKILAGNIQRLGIRNAVVTNMRPDAMEKEFEEFFDKIIVDAPCSGEGMFRKDEDAIREWSTEHTYACALRQMNILDSAVKMLKYGGKLVYSTCTFSPDENEEICRKLCKKYPDIVHKKSEKMLPHKIKGEGHFAAVFEKKGCGTEKIRRIAKEAPKEYIKIYRDFEKENLNCVLKGSFINFGNELYLLPESFGTIEKIKCVLPGLHLGEIRKGRIVPSHHLCISLKAEDFKRTINPDESDIIKYRKGESVLCSADEGFGAVLYRKRFPLGWYKMSGGQMKNHYPKYLRS